MTVPCPDDFEIITKSRSFYGRTIPVFLLTILSFLLFTHAIYYEIKLRGHERFRNLKVMRLLYIGMQIPSLLFLICDILRFSIDPFTHFLQESSSCSTIAHAVFHLPTTFYFLYLAGLLHRLDLSFKDTQMALSHRLLYTLWILVFITFILPNLFLVLDLLDDDDSSCIATWNPPDLERELTYCAVPPSSLIAFQYHIFEGNIALIIALNCAFGMFCKMYSQDHVNGLPPFCRHYFGTPFEANLVHDHGEQTR